MPTLQTNYLLAEDADHQYVIAELMKVRLPYWGTSKVDYLVEIKPAHGVNDALKHETLIDHWKIGGLKVLGLVVDADDNPKGRWQSIRDFCLKYNATPPPPEPCPANGFIIDSLIVEGIHARFGAWIMPDNRRDGMVESLCFDLIPPGNEKLMDHATNCVGTAKAKGAPFIARHDIKARVHTWLAWQNPPGQSVGRALANKTLLPNAKATDDFVAWFRKLYGV